MGYASLLFIYTYHSRRASDLNFAKYYCGVYEQAVDRDSAYEMLQNKVAEREQQKQDAELAKQQAKEQETLAKQQAKEQERLAREQQKKRNVRRVKELNLLKIL